VVVEVAEVQVTAMLVAEVVAVLCVELYLLQRVKHIMYQLVPVAQRAQVGHPQVVMVLTQVLQ
jgi:hypothetical protein